MRARDRADSQEGAHSLRKLGALTLSLSLPRDAEDSVEVASTPASLPLAALRGVMGVLPLASKAPKAPQFLGAGG